MLVKGRKYQPRVQVWRFISEQMRPYFETESENQE